MRWKDRRCVSQSYRFAVVVCAFSSISGFVYRPYTSAVIVSSHSAVFFGTTQQVSVFSCLIQYYTLVYLKYFMTVQNKKPLCALLIFSSETILIITRRKMNVLCPTLRYYAHLPDTCNYVKNQEVLRAIERKVLHQKLPPWSFNFSESSLFLGLLLDLSK